MKYQDEENETCPLCKNETPREKMLAIADEYQHEYEGNCRVCETCEQDYPLDQKPTSN